MILVLIRNLKIITNLFNIVMIIRVVVGLACVDADCWLYSEYSSAAVNVVIIVVVIIIVVLLLIIILLMLCSVCNNISILFIHIFIINFIIIVIVRVFVVYARYIIVRIV